MSCEGSLYKTTPIVKISTCNYVELNQAAFPNGLQLDNVGSRLFDEFKVSDRIGISSSPVCPKLPSLSFSIYRFEETT